MITRGIIWMRHFLCVQVCSGEVSMPGPMKVEAALKNGAAASLLKERAYDELKRRILNDDYPPGSFLAERRLAEELGMSKTPVKAALERLELEGFLLVSPQQGI